MAFDYNNYVADIDEFISIVESEGYRLGYHDQSASTINFSPVNEMDMRSATDHIEIIEDIADEIFDASWIWDIRTIGRGEILVKYTDLYM